MPKNEKKPSTPRRLDTPSSGVRVHDSSRTPGEKPTPAPDSLGAAAEIFADSVARSLPPTRSSAPPSSRKSDPELVQGLLNAMHAALRDGDHERAIRAADLALRKQPGLAVALMCKRESSRLVETAYRKAIGPLSSRPRLRMVDVDRLHLDAEAKRVLALVDGSTTFASIITASGMDRLVVLRVLDALIARGVIDPSVET